MQPSTIELFGSQVRYRAFGSRDGRTVLVVHGFRGNHRGLAQVVDELPQYRVVVPDLPGYGDSTPMTTLRHDVSGLAEFVRAFMEETGLERPVLLGHSFGTIIAAEFAAKWPELISELILVNPIASRPSAGWNLLAAKFVEAYYWLAEHLPESLAQRAIKSRSFNRLMSLTLAKTRDATTRRMVFRHHLSDLDFPQNREVIAESYADSLAKTAADHAPQIPHRTLLVAGERDAISPVRYQRKLQSAMPDAKLVVIPGVGHLVHLETPTEAARAIADFLG